MATSSTKVTVVAVYKGISEAQAAAGEVATAGITNNDVYIHSAMAETTAGADPYATRREEGLKGWFKSLFEGKAHTAEQRDYEAAFKSGNTILAVATNEQNAPRVADILNRYSPVNIHEEAAGAAAMETAAGISLGTRGSVGNPPLRGASSDTGVTRINAVRVYPRKEQ